MNSSISQFPLLEQIDHPAQLRELPDTDLLQVAAELRHFLLTTLSQHGGHFAANLGVVELTVALHYVFNTPEDRLVWDVGHQSYPHKILTGRRNDIPQIRKDGGISGFPKRSESPYDAFGVGHSSTSISAALGMALAAERQGQDRKVVAVIGDGAMTAGMAFEALNHAGSLCTNLLVILNDNEMSISPNVGALKRYLGRVLSSRFYASLREGSKTVLRHMPASMFELARRTETHMKGMIVPGTLFEELGFNYIGPIDGHDLPYLVQTLQNVRELDGPQFVHVVTQKGKGFMPAEEDPCKYHAVTSFDFETGKMEKKAASGPTYSQVFGDWLCDMAAQDPLLMGITPAMREGSGMVQFSDEFPEQYFDVGIAEQHSVTLAAGMACDGLKPVVAIYSTFLQRAYDQLIHDVALQKLPVLYAIDRAGLVGGDGDTHAGSFDLSFMRCIPDMLIMAPADENECRQMLTTGFLYSDGPSAVRYPRGTGPGVEIEKALKPLPVGKAELRRKGKKIAILAFGSMVSPSLEAAEELNATVVNMRFVKPLDTHIILKMVEQHELLVTVEENTLQGGAGSAVNEFLVAHSITLPVLNLGLPDRLMGHGSPNTMLSQCGLDKPGIINSIMQYEQKLRSPAKVSAL